MDGLLCGTSNSKAVCNVCEGGECSKQITCGPCEVCWLNTADGTAGCKGCKAGDANKINCMSCSLMGIDPVTHQQGICVDTCTPPTFPCCDCVAAGISPTGACGYYCDPNCETCDLYEDRCKEVTSKCPHTDAECYCTGGNCAACEDGKYCAYNPVSLHYECKKPLVA